MKFRGTSHSADRVPTDTLVLTFFQDERPLKGPTGLSDWHLCGRLSKLVMGDFVDGHFGEPLLMPATERLPFERIMVFGLGPRDKFGLEKYRDIINRLCDALVKMNIPEFALALPGVTMSDIDPAEAAEIFGQTAAACFRPHPELFDKLAVTVFADRDQLKSINPVLARLERSQA